MNTPWDWFFEKERTTSLEAYLKNIDYIDFGSQFFAVSDFLCSFPVLRDSIRNCVSHLKAYHERAKSYYSEKKKNKNTKPDRPFNILIIAPPGAGKSTLAKKIAEELFQSEKTKYQEEDHYVEYNLTRLETDDHFLEMLEEISKHAQESSDKNTLKIILLDECDSLFKFPFFQKMLMPIWDGKYYSKHGTEFKIPPCILLFVMSKIPDSTFGSRLRLLFQGISNRKPLKALIRGGQQGDLWQSNIREYIKSYLSKFPKGLDFYTRMVDVILIPSMNDPIRNESVYVNTSGSDKVSLPSRYIDIMTLSIHLIKRNFPNVKRIDKRTLYYLASGLSSVQIARDMEMLFFKSLPSSKETFSYEDFPNEEVSRFGQFSSKIPTFGDSDYVIIRK